MENINKYFHLITEVLVRDFPDIQFALIFGSSKDGKLKKGSDIDLGVYYDVGCDKSKLLLNLIAILEEFFPDKVFDIAVLNLAGPVLRFEALQGRILFVREMSEKIFSDFYALSCAEYEDYSFWMKKQLEYRGYEVQWGD